MGQVLTPCCVGLLVLSFSCVGLLVPLSRLRQSLFRD
jgi:hypothetical protein